VKSRRPTAPLFVQVLALALLSLIAAQVINLLILFSLPPPVPDFYRVAEIAQALQGKPQPTKEPKDHRPLVTRIQAKAPEAVEEGRGVAAVHAELARTLAVDPAQIVIDSGFHRFLPDRRVLRQVHQRMAHDFGPHEDRFLLAPFKVGVRQADGRWLVLEPKPSFSISAWQARILLWFLVSALVMAPVAYLFARRLASPIALFAEAADRLGRDPRAPPLELKGPAEIAAAVATFNAMQERLRRYVEDRTAMIGAVAHDLRTPLTRLRFRIEAAPEELRAKMAGDIDQMDAMLGATMAFVRDAARPAARTRLELSSLLESLTDDMAETGTDAKVERADRVVVEGDPVALRRLFANLLDNAVKFGGRARARVFAEDDCAVVEIDDDGPGLPADELERVFEPFYRREPSRSRETGGIGLGLAVVRSVARAHGGDAQLSNRPDGGLRAKVTIPL